MTFEKLNTLEAIIKLRRIVQSTIILKSLFDFSELEWMKSYNVETDEHLIKNVFTSGEKTDVVRAYVSKIVKLYLNNVGVVPGGWSKKTLTSENEFTKHSIDRIATTKVATNKELFMITATRILGVDATMVHSSFVDDENFVARAEKWVIYLANSTDETEDPDIVYGDIVRILAALQEKELLDDQFFADLITTAGDFFDNANDEATYKDIDPLDILDTVITQTVRDIPRYEAAQSRAAQLFAMLAHG